MRGEIIEWVNGAVSSIGSISIQLQSCETINDLALKYESAKAIASTARQFCGQDGDRIDRAVDDMRSEFAKAVMNLFRNGKIANAN